MAVETYALTSIANVKSYLDISASTWDTLLEFLVNSCSIWIEQYCGGRRFKNSGSDITEYYDGDYFESGQSIIFLKNYPVASITGVYYASGNLGNPTWIAYDTNTYYIKNYERGELFFWSLPKYRQQIKVVYKAGYTSIPYDLQMACMQLVAREFTRRKSEGITNESVGGASVAWDKEISADIKQTLNNYIDYAV